MKNRRKPPRRWVVKAGSSMVCSGGSILLRAWMRQVAELRKRGIEVIWITSGAIASAVDRTGFHTRNRRLSEKQALSAIGQPLVMDLYNLSLQVCMGAERLVILTDVEGLYDEDPRKNPRARLIGELKGVDARLLRQVGGTAGSSRGTGGMFSKLSAAKMVGKQGIDTCLIRGDLPDALLRVAAGDPVGTRILPNRNARRIIKGKGQVRK